MQTPAGATGIGTFSVARQAREADRGAMSLKVKTQTTGRWIGVARLRGVP